MNNQAIGNFIKALRTEQGLTQKQLAEKINVTDKAVSRWETGKGAPDVTLLLPLSQLFGVSVNELLRGERIQADQKLEKSEETILETLTQSKKRISRLHAIIYALFALVEAVAIYGFTFNASPSDAMGLLIGLAFIVTPLTSLLLGITNVPVCMPRAVCPVEFSVLERRSRVGNRRALRCGTHRFVLWISTFGYGYS